MDGHPAPVIWNIEAVPLPHELLQQVNISCSGCNPHSRALIVVGLREIHPYVRQTVRDEGAGKKTGRRPGKKSLLVQNTYIWFAGLFGCSCLLVWFCFLFWQRFLFGLFCFLVLFLFSGRAFVCRVFANSQLFVFLFLHFNILPGLPLL